MRKHSELSTMFACCCIAKIFFYVILICYHIGDAFFDWYNFALLRSDHKFSGVSLSASKGSAIEILFVVSCFTGTLFSVALMYTYGCYIGHHWYCMNNASYSTVNGGFSFLRDRKCDKKCNRKYVNRELWISFLELFLKDGIQTVILFWAFNCPQRSLASYPHDWMSIGFLVCSTVGHLKLCLCFITKLVGCGAGEDLCPEKFCCVKVFLCIIGSLVSAIFLSVIFVVLKQTHSMPEKMAMALGRNDSIFEPVSTRTIHELCLVLNSTEALLNKTNWF